MDHHNTPNYRLIAAKFVGATSKKGSRLCIEQPARYNDERPQRKYFSYSHNIGNLEEQAFQILVNNGWKVICRTSDANNYYFLCDNWGDEYLQVKDLK